VEKDVLILKVCSKMEDICHDMEIIGKNLMEIHEALSEFARSKQEISFEFNEDWFKQHIKK
jgi:hypothetical protein